jgi:putative addiction module component (TIGR02574 family)
MASARKNVEYDAMKLPSKSQALLAERLIASLDAEPESGVLEAWLLEAERRYAALKEHRVKGKPAVEVFKRISAADSSGPAHRT